MVKLKKVVSLALVGTFIATSSLSVIASDNRIVSESAIKEGSKYIGTNVKKEQIALKGDIGTIIHDGDLIFERLPNGPIPDTDITPYASTQGFSVNFNGNQNLTQQFLLSGSYRYWKVWIQNTGSSAIKYSTTGPENGKVHTIPAGQTWSIYSTKKWRKGTYNSNFTAGSGMYGKAACRIATTFEELDI